MNHYIVYRLVGIFSCINLSYGRQEEPANQISRLLLRMRRMYVDVDSIRLYSLKMNGIHRTQIDHARVDLLLPVI